MPKTLHFALLPSAHYYQALQQACAKAKKRIAIHAMILAWTPGVEQLVPLISDALDRGVSVDIVGDRYTRLYLPLWGQAGLRRRSPGSWHHTWQTNQKLASKGAQVSYIGALKPFNPFSGRCHSKAMVVDDTIFSFGGINFGDHDPRSGAPSSDYMLSVTYKPLADSLHQLIRTLARNEGALPDAQQAIDTHTTLLFDGGMPKTSVIYDTACQLATRAQTIYFVSQYPPSGLLGSVISKKQNVCYFNRAGTGDFPLNVPFLFDKLRYGLVNHYQKKPYLHAKFMLTEEADGNKHVISGSNNFSWSGVQLGTKEIAIHSTDPKLWQTLYAYLESTIA